MVDTKAEEDDDEGFGDFTFASFANHALHSDHINGRKSTADYNDDEWGDFVESPLRSELSSGLSTTQSLPNPSKPFDPFGFFPDHSNTPSQSAASPIESVPSHSGSEKTQWMKPKGALPLSIFGDEEQEEEEKEKQSGVVYPPVGDVRNGSNMFIGLAFNDVIANLYNPSQQIKAENGLNSNSNGTNSNSNGLKSNSSGLNSDLFAGNNDNQSSQINTVSDLSSNSNLFAENNDSQSPQIKAVSGLNSNSDLFAGNSDDQVSGLNSNSSGLNLNMDIFSGNTGSETFANICSQSPQNRTQDSNGLNSSSNVSSSNFNFSGMDSNFGVLISNSDPPGGNEEFDGDDDGWEFKDAYSELKVGDGNVEVDEKEERNSEATGVSSDFGNGSRGFGDLFSASNELSGKSREVDISFDFKPLTVAQNDFSFDPFSKSEQNGIENGLNYHSDVGIVDSDESFGDFECAFTGTGLKQQDKPKVDDISHSESEVEVHASDGKAQVDRKVQGNSEVNGFSSEFGNGSHGSIDLFSASNGFSGKPREVDISFDFKPLTVAQNGFSSDSFFDSEEKGTDQVVETIDSDESFGDFEAAFTGTGQDEPKVSDPSHFEAEVLTSDGKAQGNETMSTNPKGALPLSIFGDEELETDNSLNIEDAFTYAPSSHLRNGISSRGSNISIHDLLSNLYSQAEQIPSVEKTEKLTGYGLDSSDKVLDPSLMKCDDDFDDASWEFRDASSQTRDQTSLHSPGEAHQKFSTKLKLNNYVDFYCKLKDELSFVCKCHLGSLKKAQNTASLSGEDAKAAAIGEEIQEAWKELHKQNVNSEEYSEYQPPRDVCLNEFLEVLHELKFQDRMSKPQIGTVYSRRKALPPPVVSAPAVDPPASDDSDLANRRYPLCIQSQSYEEACQDPHWIQAEKDFRSAIELMEHTTSMLNVLTLGSMEDQYIYVSIWFKMISVCAQELKHGSSIWKQVVVVLGTSIKLYKPWILSSSVDCTSIYALFEECCTLWSSSGIEEALQGISDPIDFKYHSTVEALRESIMYIHNLDALAIGNHVFNQPVSVCRLSLLTSEAVPEMKMVLWSGENYFLTLANLWANLISSDPPELPHLHLKSLVESNRQRCIPRNANCKMTGLLGYVTLSR
ncbi:hypothetical protein HYC85_010183 [Camellia sinensis]|uniref:Synergin gamma C-terminal domain-containing protein n=1 Tax=Camellia sinensis TaxID=4442 RepID=A0A7J7HHR2_CAMSI|nr:hypothetical protein HYC85_010183 [Camellia sinensis]